MRGALYLKQKKPIIALIMGAMLLLISVLDILGDKMDYSKTFILVLISAGLFGYSISYEITAEFQNKRHFKLFGFTLFKRKLLIEFPDYIAVFRLLINIVRNGGQ